MPGEYIRFVFNTPLDDSSVAERALVDQFAHLLSSDSPPNPLMGTHHDVVRQVEKTEGQLTADQWSE